MRIRSFIRRQSWMSSLEWRCLLRHLRAFETMIAESATPVTPFLVHHLEQALTTRLLVARVEGQLLVPDDGALPGVPAVETLERIFEMRDRLHAAMAALESVLLPGAPGESFAANADDENSAVETHEQALPEPNATEATATPRLQALPQRAHFNRAERRALKKYMRVHGQDTAPGDCAYALSPQTTATESPALP